jgi:predicted LPLAT superfamily acyltransferase
MSGHWAQMSERGTLAGMMLLVWIHRHLGRWPFLLVLWPVMIWYFLLHKAARRASQAYLQRVRPELQNRPVARRWTNYRHFMSFQAALVDKVAAWSGDIGFDRLRGEGKACLHEAYEGGKGGLILVAHHGNLDVAGAMTQRYPDMNLTILMHTRNAGKFNELLERVTGRVRPHILEVTELTPAHAQDLAERVERGGFVVIAADRIPIEGNRMRRLTFLDGEALFPEGPFWLAALLRCRVYTLACVREGDGFHIDFELLDDAAGLPRRDRQAWIASAMQRYADQLGRRVHAHPLQWFNFYPFWLTDPGHIDAPTA